MTRQNLSCLRIELVAAAVVEVDQLVNKRLIAGELRACRPLRRPRLSAIHRRNHLFGAQDWQNLQTWNRVIWSVKSIHNHHVAVVHLQLRHLPNLEHYLDGGRL